VVAGVLLAYATNRAGEWRVQEGRKDLYEAAFIFTEATAQATKEHLGYALATGEKATRHISELVKRGAKVEEVVSGNESLLGNLGVTAVVEPDGTLRASTKPLAEEEKSWLHRVGSSSLLNA